MKAINRLFPWIALGLFSGCSSYQLPEVMAARDVSGASSAPIIKQIVDIGCEPVPISGRLKGTHPDGHAVIGEQIIIRGSNFGKQPTVVIGGIPAEVITHLEGEAILVRVPWGIDPGLVTVEVAQSMGRDVQMYPVKRLGLAAIKSELRAFNVHSSGEIAQEGKVLLPLQVAGVRHVLIGFSGALAYAAGGVGAAKLWTIDLTGMHPRVVAEEPLPGSRVLDLSSAGHTPVGVAITDTHLVFFDTTVARRPLLSKPQPMPGPISAKKIISAALNREGKLLALLLSELNEVALLRTDHRSLLGRPVIVKVLPDARLSMVRDVVFTPESDTLWVLSGDTPLSISAGEQPLGLTLLQISSPNETGNALEVTLHQSWTSGIKGAPRELALARGAPIASGTAIRSAPSRSAVYVALAPSAFLTENFNRVPPPAEQQQVIRTTIAQQAEVLLAGPSIISGIDVVGKTQILLALGFEKRENGYYLQLLSRRAWQAAQPYSLGLGVLDVGPRENPLELLGEVCAQP